MIHTFGFANFRFAGACKIHANFTNSAKFIHFILWPAKITHFQYKDIQIDHISLAFDACACINTHEITPIHANVNRLWCIRDVWLWTSLYIPVYFEYDHISLYMVYWCYWWLMICWWLIWQRWAIMGIKKRMYHPHNTSA